VGRACVVDTTGWVAAGGVEVAVLVDQVVAAAKAVDPLLGPDLVTALDRIATYADPTPLRAASTDVAGGQPMWCEDHQCDTRECPKVNGVMVCERTFEYHPGADPTGEAVMADVLSDWEGEGWVARARIIDLLRLRLAVDRELAEVMPKHQARRPSGKLEVTDEWCVTCQRGGDATQAIYLDKERRPRYRAEGGGHLCWWCGRRKSEWRAEPTEEIVRARKAGRTITEAMVRRAQAAARPKAKRRR